MDNISQMTNEPDDKTRRGTRDEGKGKRTDYDVAKGLKQLYNSVLDEPLPPSFHELLTKLDQGKR